MNLREDDVCFWGFTKTGLLSGQSGRLSQSPGTAGAGFIKIDFDYGLDQTINWMEDGSLKSYTAWNCFYTVLDL